MTRHILSFCILLLISISIIAPPPPRNNLAKVEAESVNGVNDNKVAEEVEDDLPKYEFHYSKYLEKVVQILEKDPRFNEKLKTMNEQEMKDGKLADHFDLVSQDVANELTKVKLEEIERLREAIAKQIEADNGAHNVQAPEHLDVEQLDKFHAEDLRKLIRKTIADIEKIDKERTEKFKQYEMEKRAKFDHEKAKLPEAERKKLEEEHKAAEERHKQHEKINHPGDRKQLEEVWEEKDHMDKEGYNPRTFFALHDLNGDGFWNNEEIDALFQLELEKMYNETNPDDDPKEKVEEMYRMRDHVISQMDKNKDRMISLEEFLADNEAQASTPSPEGWNDLADQKIYTDEELRKFEEEYAKQQGWGEHAYETNVPLPPPTTTPLTIVHNQQQHIETHPKVDPIMAKVSLIIIFLNFTIFIYGSNHNGCDANKNGKSCCRFKQFVNLYKVDSFILAPHNTNVGYCGGSCSLRDNLTNNALIRYKLKEEDFVGCCHPKDFVNLQILKRDKHGIISEYNPNIYIYSCRCG
uniref:TGF_BETA_2 domain-containing protein n=1 Tax=Parastrongyloides trichosuri TaxID=131310 RepID=A0A0N4ZBL4_PARTI